MKHERHRRERQGYSRSIRWTAVILIFCLLQSSAQAYTFYGMRALFRLWNERTIADETFNKEQFVADSKAHINPFRLFGSEVIQRGPLVRRPFSRVFFTLCGIE